MATVGSAALIIALAVSVYGVAVSLYGAKTRRRDLVDSGRNAAYALAALTTLAFVILEVAFLRSDFTFKTVAEHSSTTTPTFYKASASWSSQEGSLLLWLFLLSLWTAAILYATRRRMRDVAPYATAILLGLGAFFAGLLVFAASPFQTLGVAPSEGAGLNPLLRHPSMMIHPPMLYAGYTLFAVPFAFAAGALITRRVDAEWIGVTRRFSLAAWFFLGVGILLGARWSYQELGWGGYWAWDPVENASLLPWLTGTAFLHSVMIQEKRGMLKIWNASLVLATGVLCILGTFLVRSGILDSIHAFGASTLGVPFVILIGLLIAGSVALVISRRELLRSEHKLDSVFSRESVFLANNVILVGVAFVVFWGTFFPLISEAVTGTKSAVGPPWFDRYTVPLVVMLVFLSGIGPVIAWRRQTRATARKSFLWPTVAMVGTLVVLVPFGVLDRPWAWLTFGAGALVAGTVVQEFVRGTRARRAMSRESVPVAMVSLVRRNRRRYGGYIVHLGMAVLFVGVAASSAFEKAQDSRLDVGQTVTVDGYQITYASATARIDQRAGRIERIVFGANLRVRKDGKDLGTLHPERGFYPPVDRAFQMNPIASFFEGEATSEIAMDAGLQRDLWTAVSPDVAALQGRIEALDEGFTKGIQQAGDQLAPGQIGALIGQALNSILRSYTDDPPPATFRVLSSPMVSWIWLGGIVVFFGAIVALWPPPGGATKRADARLLARVSQELGRA
ncbi:heme lyase CcmF/NrfE family subunit [Paraconexibacter algicola]|uniref:Cytochrome C biogenesis protein n=1 Tax=Paraconexibacter algicola TaxID=2133960 RepID=A0A2T4UDW0_9ACTN|nr:heme lyase CcmF/NrfE family subunit [Paraconexibacter algicola]PTL55689.1 cytochrome C biogenesis protein [Paraconexibacter algicola]